MPSRFKSRQQALQTLYLWDIRQQPVDAAIRDYYDSLASDQGEPVEEHDQFAEQLATGTADQAAAIDDLIGRHSEHWRLERMPAVDRNILRLATYEMRNLATPTAVVIDQALELARRFSTDESLSFLNGVLDAIDKEVRVR